MSLEIVQSRKIDLILLDIHLPVHDGYYVLNKLRSKKETANIPVIAVSAAATEDDLKRGQQAGFDDYVTKPFKFQNLREVIFNFLKK